MKKFFTVRNILISAACFLGLLVFIFSFITAYRSTNGNDWSQINGIIWGARTTVYSDGSSQTVAPEDATKALALPLIGALLAFIGGLCAFLVALFGNKLFKNETVGKVVLFVAGGLMILGGVFTFFTQGAFESYLAKEAGITVEDYKKALELLGSKVSCGLPIVSGILAILGGGAVVVSQFIPEKK